MHPAYSVIVFTTASGAGYGLLASTSILLLIGPLPTERWVGLACMGTALALISAGLLASTFHLGHPERAWRAVTQWRTSWLSREGVAALLTYLPAGALAVAWVGYEAAGGLWTAAAVLSFAGAVLTVYCTAMIYASLWTVPQWRDRLVVPVYLLLALASGAVLLNLLTLALGVHRPIYGWLAAGALAAGLALKLAYWRRIDTRSGPTTMGRATGLGGQGRVRPLEPPHTGENYIMREMGYRVARTHAHRLRRLAVVAGFGVPGLVSLALASGVAAGPGGIAAAALATVSTGAGLLVERWLFFAEARHVVRLYYEGE